MRKLQTIMIATTLFIGAAIPAGAQQPPSPAPPPTTPYGPPIDLDAAKKAMAFSSAKRLSRGRDCWLAKAPIRLSRGRDRK